MYRNKENIHTCYQKVALGLIESNSSTKQRTTGLGRPSQWHDIGPCHPFDFKIKCT